MFKNLKEEIKELNEDTTSEKKYKRSKKLKALLLGFGIPLSIIGFIGIVVAFLFFFSAFKEISGENLKIPLNIIIGFFIFLGSGVLLIIGSDLTSIGFKIIVNGYKTFLSEPTCPNCHEIIEKDSTFCHNCGTKLLNQCPNCGKMNDVNSKFCSNCGNKLNK